MPNYEPSFDVWKIWILHEGEKKTWQMDKQSSIEIPAGYVTQSLAGLRVVPDDRDKFVFWIAFSYEQAINFIKSFDEPEL